MPLIPFPDIPPLPGVPAIPRSPLFPPLATAGLNLLIQAFESTNEIATRWGIFDEDGNALADPNNFQASQGQTLLSTSAVEYSKELQVSDFPLERGSFAAYNKVERPATPSVTFAFAGSESDRTQFLNVIDDATRSTNLYSIVTPEVTYVNYTIERYNYQRRNSKGATLLIVELSLKEIRQVSATFTSTIVAAKQPDATPKVDAGKVQSQVPRVSVLQSIANKLGIQ